MFKKTFLIVILFSILSLILFSCSKDSPTKSSASNLFSVQFAGGYQMDKGWIILYNLTGDSAIAAKRVFYGDNSVNFGNIGATRASITKIDVYFGFGQSYIEITTNLDVQAGSWSFADNQELENKTVNISRFFPDDFYDYSVVSLPNIAHIFFGLSGSSDLNRTFYLNYLDEAGKFSAYSSVYNENSNTAFAGWVLNQDFPLDSSFVINLDKPMQTAMVITSRPIDIFVNGCYRGSNYTWYGQSFYVYSAGGVTPHFVHYSPDFPAQSYLLEGLMFGSNDSYYFRQKHNSLPSTLEISNAYLTYNYNQLLHQFENIAVVGTADQLNANWSYFGFNYDIYWTVYTGAQKQTIFMPVLPDSVIMDLTGTTILPFFQPGEVTLDDYDTAKNIDDIINMFFKSSVPPASKYQKYYNYSRSYTNLTETKKQKMIEKYLKK